MAGELTNDRGFSFVIRQSSFVNRQLSIEVSNRSRKMVTLEWNREDILDVSRLGLNSAYRQFGI